MADDLGYETIGANGGKSYKTPYLDRVATQGMRFTHCYAQPLCTPSRIQVMTGIYNVRNYVRFGLLDEGQTTFGHLLQQAGYATGIVGKWQLGKDPLSPKYAGFDEYCLWQVSKGRVDSTGRDTRFRNPILEINGDLTIYQDDEFGPDVVSDYALEFIEKSVKAQQSFFLYYPMILTHCPFSPTPDSPDYLLDDTTIMKYKGEPRYFADMVSYMDKIVGKIQNKLNDLGIEENTMLIFTGDNGTDKPIISLLDDREVAGAKGESNDAGTRVPLLISWPGKIEAGEVHDDLIDFTDFLPTICQVAGTSVPESLKIDGRSFWPQLQGEPKSRREWIYSWYSRSGAVNEARIFARDQSYKLYATGEFYHVPDDYMEENPINNESLDQEKLIIYNKLKSVIDHYEPRRGENIEIKNRH